MTTTPGFSISRLFKVLLLGGALALCSAPSQAQNYLMDENWPAQLPDPIVWGQVPNVTIDQEGNIYAFHRAVPPVLKFNPSGELIDTWGSDVIVTPHGFRVAPDGTLWATDYNRENGQIVVQFDTHGTVLQTLGTKGVAGNDDKTFDGPADVAVAPNGDVFVVDGHWNNRVVKFDENGNYLMEWGQAGSGPGDFNLPHSIVIDQRGRVLVADRGNERIQVFDQQGRYITEWHQFGWPSGLFIDTHDVLWVADYQDKRGVTYGSAETGAVLGFIAGSEPEGIVVDAQGNVYTGEVTGGEGGEGKIMRKFTTQP